MAKVIPAEEIGKKMVEFRSKYMSLTLGEALKYMPNAHFVAGVSLPKESGVFDLKADSIASTWLPLDFVEFWRMEEQCIGSRSFDLAVEILKFLKLAGYGRQKPRI